MICEIHKDSMRTYGRPQIWGQLRRRGVRVSSKRAGRLMTEQGLVGAHSRKKWRRGHPGITPAPDLLQRDFTADRSDQRWIAISPSSSAVTASSTWPALSTSVTGASPVVDG